MNLADLIILLVVLALVFWVLTVIPFPEPSRKIIHVVFAVIAILILLSFLLGGPLHISLGTR